jgi:predicted ATPase
MFLRRLRLRNVRSIEALDMSFERGENAPRMWTFILGENGVGKSTVLRAIALASAGGEALPEILGEPDWWLRQGCDTASIELEISTAQNKRRVVRLAIRRGEGVRKLLAENSATLEELDAALSHSSRNYFVVGYGVSRRRSSDTPLTTAGSYRNNRAQNVATLFSGDATLVSIEQWAMDLDYRRGQQGLAAVREALNALLPDVRFDGVDKERRQLRFDTADGSLPLTLLSDGYQAMAAWCGDLLFRITETFADQQNPLNARGLLLIDELDLHLHPLWQRQLVSFLNATLPRFQIVATTHSPLTVHQAGEGELFVLRRSTAKSPSVLDPYEGAPNRLLLHQLIQSPIFGLDTLDSPPVARLRQELRTLKGLPPTDAATIRRDSDLVPTITAAPVPQAQRARRIREIKKELESAPDWNSIPNYLQPTNKLLARIAGELSSPDRGAVAARRPKSGARSKS